MRIKIHILVVTIFSLLVASCGDNSTPKNDESSIQRKWTLQKTEDRSEKYQSEEFKNQPIEIILSLEENGYFVIYDTFLDPKFDGAGINKIQERSKGQWDYKDDVLTLNHMNVDNPRKEVLKVKTPSKDELVLQGADSKANIYTTYNKR